MTKIAQLVSNVENFASELVAITAANAAFNAAQERSTAARVSLTEWTGLFTELANAGDFTGAEEADAERRKAQAEIDAAKAEIDAAKATPHNDQAVAACKRDLKEAQDRLKSAVNGARGRLEGLGRVEAAIERKIAGKQRDLERAGLKSRRTFAAEIAEAKRELEDIRRQASEVREDLQAAPDSLATQARKANPRRHQPKAESLTQSPFAGLDWLIFKAS